jgi:LysR family transcriptional regulator, hca operon transcriptional activator
MELRHLRYFVAVAEELNFRKAAERLHIARPPLSVQIRKLEMEVGTDLLSRGGRNIELTQAGRVFLERARQTLAHANQSVVLARQTAAGEIGQLSIGYNMPAGFRVFPTIVPAFKKKWPNVHLTFHDLKISQQLEGLRRDELDVGFVWLPIPEEEFDIQELLQEPMIVVLPENHRLAAQPRISIKDLSGEPLVIISRVMDSETFRGIEQMFRRAKAKMNVVYELENSLTMVNFVAMGVGCSLLPDYTRRILQQGTIGIPLEKPMFKTLAIIKKKGRGDLVESFYRFTVDSRHVEKP